MIKADGYGHGMIECARTLQESGCLVFGVAELCEAVVLRESGISSTVYSMIGFAPEDADLFFEYNITPVIYDMSSLQALSECAVKRNTSIAVHVKVDTGMSRLGLRFEQFEKFIQQVEKTTGVTLGGVASHFACSDDRESAVTGESLDVFQRFQKHLSPMSAPVYHIANSGGTLYHAESQYDMVRCGISLYGYYPDGRKPGEENELEQVMSFSSRVLQVKEIPSGTGVSYGHTYITHRPTTLAVLPVGYEDGFSRKLSNCGEVLIRGRRAPVLGRVCMNLSMVDVTDIDGVQAGDEVVLLGEQGLEKITADDMAGKIDTISYEVLCMVGNNNERKFIE